MTKVKHVLGISGGKDSAALAIYLNDKYPELDVEYYTCDTGKELDETYALINRLEGRLGKLDNSVHPDPPIRCMNLGDFPPLFVCHSGGC